MTAAAAGDRHVLVTRARRDATAWIARLATRGMRASVMPCVTSERIADAETRRRLVEGVAQAHCLLVTSVRGVECVAATTVDLPAALDIAAVGPASAAAVRRLFGRTAYVARGGTSRALGRELAARWGAMADRRHVVVAAAEGGLDDADVVLAAAGVQVTRVAVYRTSPVPPMPRRRDLAREGTTDVLLASPSAVQGLVNQATVGEEIRLYTIGPTTSAAAGAAGLRVTAEAPTPDIDGLLEAMQCVAAS